MKRQEPKPKIESIGRSPCIISNNYSTKPAIKNDANFLKIKPIALN